MLHSKYNPRAIRSSLREKSTMTSASKGAYDADDNLVDYILGITFEIWEERQVDLIDQYYSPDTVVFALDGVTRGSAAMIDGTTSMLAAFPDRLLLGDDVICKGDSHHGYSSHRILSPMTNSGNSMFGPATRKQVRIMNMADCVVEEAVIVREWLARDNLALVRQLGFDARDAAKKIRSGHTTELTEWFGTETDRLLSSRDTTLNATVAGVDAQRLLRALWISGDESFIETSYAPYAVLHRSPVETISGRPAIAAHYLRLKSSFDCKAARVDHVCHQPAGESADHVATRWAVCGTHVGDYLGIKATGRPVYIMGVTHRRIVQGRVAVEWTAFDSLGVMAQLL